MDDQGPLEQPVRRRFRHLAIDLAPLRTSRDFRLLWFGELISESGHQITVVAVFFQVFQLTRSPAAVGLVGLVQMIPLLIASIGGGPLVDVMDRRILLLITQIAFAGSSSLLLLGALLGHPPLWLVYGAIAIAAGLSGIASPTRSAMTPNLVSRAMLPSALALNQVMWTSAMLVGPAVGGVVIARFGLVWAYGADVITYGASITATLLMSPQRPHKGDHEEQPSGLSAIREGFRFLRGRRVLRYTFIVDLVAMIFGMPRALFPVLALTQFHRGPEVVGALFAAPAFGALAGALTAGWVNRVQRQGTAVLIAVAVWGLGITGFGLVGRALIPALILLAIAGAADVISAVYRSTILQLSVPDNLRGRMSGMHILVVTGGPRLGDVEAGVVAQIFTPTVSVVSGGLACIVGVGLIALVVPEFRDYRVDEP